MGHGETNVERVEAMKPLGRHMGCSLIGRLWIFGT